jgi:dTDP-4-dehydrorhamnose 3,5-epimerase
VPDPERIDGVRVVELTIRTDARGGFAELFREGWLEDAPTMVQANLSTSRPGVVRGMHFHRRQADYWCVLEGRALVSLFDLRAGSPTEGMANTLDLDAAIELRGVYVPPGVAHGFYAHTQLTLLYLVDRGFDGADEFGFAWNDPELPIAWPTTEPILSERDASAPSLSEVVKDPPTWA